MLHYYYDLMIKPCRSLENLCTSNMQCQTGTHKIQLKFGYIGVLYCSGWPANPFSLNLYLSSFIMLHSPNLPVSAVHYAA